MTKLEDRTYDFGILVTGSRDYSDWMLVHNVLSGFTYKLHTLRNESDRDHQLLIIQGGAKGADSFAESIAQSMSEANEWVHSKTFPADWSKGKIAGPERNQEMLDYIVANTKQQRFFAFKDHFDFDLKKGGTEDMCRRIFDAGLEEKLTILAKLQVKLIQVREDDIPILSWLRPLHI